MIFQSLATLDTREGLPYVLRKSAPIPYIRPNE